MSTDDKASPVEGAVRWCMNIAKNEEKNGDAECTTGIIDHEPTDAMLEAAGLTREEWRAHYARHKSPNRD